MLINVMDSPPAASAEIQGDVCVIGGGAAGLTLARELSSRGVDVILLEGGGLKESRRSQAIYRGESEGRKYFKLHRSRRRYLGGSTNCWAGLCTRLRPSDFEKRSWVPHSGWPISRSDLDDYYERAGKILQIGDFHPQLDQELPSGRSMSGPGLKIPHFEPVFFQMSGPVRLGELWRDELSADQNVRLMYNANVVHLQLHEDGQRLDYVVCQAFDGPRFNVKAKRFVLACGGLENPRMLLNARDVVKTGIGNQHDLVGRYFMEHPHIDRESLWIPSGSVPSLAHYHRRKRAKHKDRIWPYLRLTAAQLKHEEILDFSLVLFRRKRIEKEAKRHPLLREVFSSTQHLHRASGHKSRIDELKRVYTFGNPLEQSPNPHSRVCLDPHGRRDELGLIHSQLEWKLTTLEKRTFRRAHELLAESLGMSDYGRMRVTPTMSLDTFPKQTKGGYHHMGTTRMSDHAKTGIVNGNCQVFGVNNLYIAGSSVFATSGAANPTLTLVALALRLAEHLDTSTHLTEEIKKP
jgi:choline dehydrogenase-like flavoprotein